MSVEMESFERMQKIDKLPPQEVIKGAYLARTIERDIIEKEVEKSKQKEVKDKKQLTSEELAHLIQEDMGDLNKSEIDSNQNMEKEIER